MSQNKVQLCSCGVQVKRFFPLFVSLAYLIIAICGIFFRFHQDESWHVLSIDASVRYVNSLDSEVITDWDNPLILKISIIIKHLFAFLFDVNIEGAFLINCAAIISISFVVLFSACLLYILTKKNNLYSLCMFSFVIPVVYAVPGYWSNTDFFTALLFLILFLSVLCSKSNNGTRKIIFSILIYSLLVLLIDCRRNSLLIVPIIIYWLLSSTLHLSKWIKITSSLFLSIVLYCFTTVGIGYILHVQESHPTAPMLISDMVIACALENRLDDYSNPLVAYPENYLCCDRRKLRAYTWLFSPSSLTKEAQNEAIKKYGENWDKWETLTETYASEWRNHPHAMMTAKLIQVTQFYTGLYLPQSVQNWIFHSFPLLKESNMRALENNHEPVYRIIMRLMMLISMAIVPFYILRHKINKYCSKIMKQAIFYTSFISFVYACSFLIVTPMPLERYLMPSITIALIILPILIVTTFLELLTDSMTEKDNIL